MAPNHSATTHNTIIPQNNIVSDMAVFHKKIVVPDVCLCLHSAVNRDQPGKNIIVTNYNNVVCFSPIPSVFRRRANNTQRPDVIVFTKNNIWVNNRRWMNVIGIQFYFDFFERDSFGVS